MITVRLAYRSDATFIADMLVEAINWNLEAPVQERATVLNHHENRHYVDSWPQPGDVGVIAESPQTGPVGAAWLRFFRAEDPGYGFIAEGIPEVSIGVIASRRGEGIGDRLLRELEHEARQRGLSVLALSVEPNNPALRLYERRGYRQVGGSGGSYTFRLDL